MNTVLLVVVSERGGMSGGERVIPISSLSLATMRGKMEGKRNLFSIILASGGKEVQGGEGEERRSHSSVECREEGGENIGVKRPRSFLAAEGGGKEGLLSSQQHN